MRTTISTLKLDQETCMRTALLTATMALVLAGCDRPPVATTTTAAASAAPTRAEEMQQIEKWRSGRVERLKKPDGWLSLVGLHWIEPGTHKVGSGKDNDIELATGPAHIGTLTLKDGKATLLLDPSSEALIDGKPATAAVELKSDAKDTPTNVSFNHGDASFQLLERSGRFALRVHDAQAKTRTGFTGIDYFDIDPAWRFNARFEAHPKGKTIDIATVINTIEPMQNPGVVVFEKGGKSYRLEAVDEGDGQLFLIFADHTNGKSTYGFRFLYADPPKNGMTVVDFNKSYNPPCVFTHYATCPLPPPENRLDLTITAGEKKYAGAVHHDESSPATVPR
jgi:uncharacterized protein (DUF1684 family)